MPHFALFFFAVLLLFIGAFEGPVGDVVASISFDLACLDLAVLDAGCVGGELVSSSPSELPDKLSS